MCIIASSCSKCHPQQWLSTYDIVLLGMRSQVMFLATAVIPMGWSAKMFLYCALDAN